MKIFITVLLIGIFSICFSQTMSEASIKKLAELVNDQTRGLDIGNGNTVRGCFAYGRTLVYQYDVNEYWSPPENLREIIIENAKEAGNAAVFFQNDINVDCYYYFGNKLLKKISTKSREFSDLNFYLGDYLSIKGHPKAKGVDLDIQPPVGWEIAEGDRPNIVKKFVYGNNTYLILIKDYVTFLSKNEIRELLEDKDYVNDLITESCSFLQNPKILNHNIVTIDRYPTLEFTMKGQMERVGIKMSLLSKFWVIYYEDKIIFLQGLGLDNMESRYLEALYNKITNSVIFPEQYNW